MATTKLTATFKQTTWTEDPPYEESAPLPRIASAVTAYTWTGDIVGTSNARYALSYAADGTCPYVGYERIEGTIGNRTGVLAFAISGEYNSESLRSTWTAIPDASSGDFAGTNGVGNYTARHGEEDVAVTFELTFDKA